MKTRFYVGNLAWAATEAELKNFFSYFNLTPLSVQIILDRATGKSKGFGFVDIEADPNEVLSLTDGQKLHGRPLRVNVAEQRAKH